MRIVLVALLLLLAGCAGTQPAGQAPLVLPDQHGHGHHPAATSTGASAVPSTGKSTGTATPIVGDYNLADVMYLQMAIANHKQGADLIALLKNHPVNPTVAELASAIESTQRTETDQMRAWLTEWGHPTEVDTNPSAHAHHGGMPITDPESIAALAASPAPEFERKFVSVLTGHQHNAVEIARQQLTDGASPAVKKFTDKVVKSRTGQISALLKFSGG